MLKMLSRKRRDKLLVEGRLTRVYHSSIFTCEFRELNASFQYIVQTQGATTMIAANGISNMVALSSIHLSLGHSEATHIGPINGANHSGVSSRFHDSIQINAMKIEP